MASSRIQEKWWGKRLGAHSALSLGIFQSDPGQAVDEVDIRTAVEA